MNCLCCGRPLNNDNGSHWHKACIKRFFGTTELPEISIDEETLRALAAETVSQGYTIPGVQKKLSLHLHSDGHHPRLTLVNYPTGYILKPQVEEFESLPEAEQLVMSMADAVGIPTVPHALIQDKDRLAYITRRIDRIVAHGRVGMLAMEDFCQLDLRLTQDKYKGSYERCAKVIERHSSRSGLDITELYMRLVFSYIVGNSDMHLKNFSLVETAERSGQYVLSPAYDLLPVNVIMPEDKEQLALSMNGKKRNLRRGDFRKFAAACNIPSTAADKMITRMISHKDQFLSMCAESLLPEYMKDDLAALINARIETLST